MAAPAEGDESVGAPPLLREPAPSIPRDAAPDLQMGNEFAALDVMTDLSGAAFPDYDPADLDDGGGGSLAHGGVGAAM
eukprot:363188-Pyramimonas_sp.AAC.1